MTLDNLEHKLKDDITAIDTELGRLEKPGLFGLMNERGRYLRMLASELKTKKLILEVIQGKKSPSALRIMGLLRPVVLVPAVTAFALISVLSVYTYMHNVPSGPWTAPQTKTAGGNRPAISEQDVYALLDDIRTANLTKDLALWKSRYSSAYLASREKKENIAEQWEKVDFKSLAYKVEDLRTGPSDAIATITWEIDFSPRKSGVVKRITQRLRADFVIEDGRLKITAVNKQES
jgi:hypothetical protein